MKKRIESAKAAQLAGEFFGNGYHCAEAVLRALLETMGEDHETVVPYATAFGGGFGETFTEACGAISGSLLAIGHQYGRKQQGDSWKEAGRLGREVVEHFNKLHGTCNCGLLRNRFGEAEQMALCRELVMHTSESVAVLLNQKMEGEDGSTEQCRETCAACA